MRFVVIVALVACSQPAQPIERPQPKPEPVVVEEPPPPKRPARMAFDVAPSPMSIAVSGGALYWTDALGSIWTMPSTGGTPKQVSDHQSPGFAFKVVAAGENIIAASRKDLLAVGERAVKLNVKGVDYPEEIVADEAFVYFTMFKKSQITRVPAGGGSPQTIGDLARGVLAVHGDSLFAVSYATGALVRIPKTGGKQHVIAKGLVRPTALAVDDTHAYVYSEKDKTLQTIDLATGAAKVLAKDLNNSDDLVADGDWLYTRSWGKGNVGTLVRVAKDGSSQTAIGEDLAAPYNIAVDDEAVYVTARDGAQIVRFEKAQLSP